MTRRVLHSIIGLAIAIAFASPAWGVPPEKIAAKNADGTVNAFIEIPAGTNEKWEVQQSSGKLEIERKDGKPRVVAYLGYPGNYGFIPQTVQSAETGGDGDPLDVLVIGGPAERGSVVRAKLIGVLTLTDTGERDDKLIAVMPGTAFASLDSIAALNAKYPGVTTIIETWFMHYKGPGRIVSKGFAPATKANAALAEAIAAHSATQAK